MAEQRIAEEDSLVEDSLAVVGSPEEDILAVVGNPAEDNLVEGGNPVVEVGIQRTQIEVKKGHLGVDSLVEDPVEEDLVGIRDILMEGPAAEEDLVGIQDILIEDPVDLAGVVAVHRVGVDHRHREVAQGDMLRCYWERDYLQQPLL